MIKKVTNEQAILSKERPNNKYQQALNDLIKNKESCEDIKSDSYYLLQELIDKYILIDYERGAE
ncbi:hypothetical protein KQI68_06915 [Peptoniphilus sp. MSJ-1]|uniref:Uncharacterized protein n=1 Tax=Peptoniphilus ovalis TaxID=2841503 RepID=A0ABS6FK37_9FIRM|nr:hypothetical protein [Peptoniphilus ovalis]MBU5669570.1 hypothetical protein [Peptoniphilus ovalis]